MRFRIVVDTAEDFDAWVERQRRPAVKPPSPLAAQGQTVYLEKGCQSCHVIRDLGGTAVGPDLTHVASRTTLAAGALDMSAENMASWLHNPQDVKPGNLMPTVDLTDQELQALVAYMMSLE
jgi:cytochrome c oxidase subunit 2